MTDSTKSQKELGLAQAVLSWWAEHQYDYTLSCGGGEMVCEEYYVYDKEPEMVVLAKAIIAKGSQP